MVVSLIWKRPGGSVVIFKTQPTDAASSVSLSVDSRVHSFSTSVPMISFSAAPAAIMSSTSCLARVLRVVAGADLERERSEGCGPSAAAADSPGSRAPLLRRMGRDGIR